jgi:hypothetical protein
MNLDLVAGRWYAATVICESRGSSAPDGGANDSISTAFFFPAHPGKLILQTPSCSDRHRPTLGPANGARDRPLSCSRSRNSTIGVLSNNIRSFAGNQDPR